MIVIPKLNREGIELGRLAFSFTFVVVIVSTIIVDMWSSDAPEIGDTVHDQSRFS